MKLEAYYSARAREYDAIYAKPERQQDLARLRDMVTRELHGRDLIEVACGTGYWTEQLAGSASSIIALDLSREVLEVARSRHGLAEVVQFLIANAYQLPLQGEKFNGALAAFWWSHVPVSRLKLFLLKFLGSLTRGGKFVLIDNNYVEGSSTPISRKDSQGNTYQVRKLLDGRETEVLKNFPSAGEVRSQLEPFCDELRVEPLEYYWFAVGTARGFAP